ncbi:hypothetical protein U1Q18_036759 [Sarracenia purpurea var. burkii]
MPQMLDTVPWFPPLLSWDNLGLPIQDQRREPSGETGEGERGWEALGKMCRGIEEKGGGIRFAKGSRCALKG